MGKFITALDYIGTISPNGYIIYEDSIKTYHAPVTAITNNPTLTGVITILGDISTNSLTITPTELSHLDNVTSNIQTQLNSKVVGNSSIVGGTHTKISYDTKGLVTGGTNATTADIDDSSNRRYVTDIEKTNINYLTGVTSNVQTQITTETYNRITGDTSLFNLVTGETYNRITGDTSLFNLYTGHTTNESLHLTSTQNDLLDGISGVTYNEINYLTGVTSNVQTQINTKIGTPISKTYSELLTLKNTSGLTIGQQYLMTDYQSVYTIPNSIIYEEGTETILSGPEIGTGSTEPLLLTATSVNTFDPIVKSSLFPQDIVYYNITSDQTRLPGCTKGCIYRRIDTYNNNDIAFDYRHIKSRRYQINVTNVHVNGNASYPLGSVIKKTGTNIIYLKLTNTTGPFTDTSLWKQFEWSNGMYAATNYQYYDDNSFYYTNGWMISQQGYGPTVYFIIPTTPSTYFDFFMFSDVPTLLGVQSSYTTIYDNIIDNGGMLNTVVFGNGFRSNTIGNGFQSNTIGDSFYSNTIGDSFYSNTIGYSFNSNTIGYSFFSNTIGNSFYSNTIGYNFNSNIIGNSFNSNTIGNSFYSNTIGNSFYLNTIGDSFYSNTIGLSFNSNTIGNGFYSNTIGNYFNSNTIGNSFNSNTIGNIFNSNTIGNSFASIDFTLTATKVYLPFPKELYTHPNGTKKLRYYDDSDSIIIVDITA